MSSFFRGSLIAGRKWVSIALAGLVVAALAALVVGAVSDDEVSRAPIRASAVETYDPIKAGEPAPDGFRQLLVRDQIAPVYEPVFTSAEAVDWPQDMLVVAVSGTTESKAYPITHLNQREMVIDHLDGEPILVSW